MPESGPKTLKLLLPLVFFSWAVLGLRVIGEIQGWGSPWVGEGGKEAGGGGALLGVAWLMPVAGLLFAWQMERGGFGPRRPGRALVLAGIGLVILVLGVVVGSQVIGMDEDGAYAVMVAAVVAGAITMSGWGRLGLRLALYGLLVRAANILLTFIAVHHEWGTHLEKPHPDIPPMEPMERAIALSMAQAFFWVPATMVFGGLVGALVALVVDKRRGTRAR